MIEMNHYVKFTCWTSIVAILWGWIVGVFQPDLQTICAFAFFCLIGICAWGVGVK